MMDARRGIVLLLSAAVLHTGCGETAGHHAGGPEGGIGSSGPGNAEEAGASPYSTYSYAERHGRRLFLSYCAVCHGESGEGDGFNSYNLDPRPHDLTDAAYVTEISDQALVEVITQGGRGVNKSVLMPAYGETLSPREIEDLVAFLRTLPAGGSAPPADRGDSAS